MQKYTLITLLVLFFCCFTGFANDSIKIETKSTNIKYPIYRNNELFGYMYIPSPELTENDWKELRKSTDNSIIIYIANTPIYLPKGTSVKDLLDSSDEMPGILGQLKSSNFLSVCIYISKIPVLRYVYDSDKPISENGITDNYVFKGKESLGFIIR